MHTVHEYEELFGRDEEPIAAPAPGRAPTE